MSHAGTRPTEADGGLAGSIRDYVVHGLAVRIHGAFPVSFALVPDVTPDLTVYAQARPPWHAEPLDPFRMLYEADPASDESPVADVGWVRGGAGVRLRYADGAMFWVSAAFDELWFTYDPPLTGADAAYYLFEPVLAFVLRQRGRLVFHASAAEIDGRAVLFCGSAGAGKSTTAGVCAAVGHPFLSDDTVAVSESGGGWVAHPGTAAIRVWDDGARALGRDAAALPRVSPTWDKLTLDMELLGGRAALKPVPVALICVFGERSDDPRAPRFEPLVGVEAVTALLPHTAANYLHDAARRSQELAQLARIAGDVPVVRLVSHVDPARLADVVGLIHERIVA